MPEEGLACWRAVGWTVRPPADYGSEDPDSDITGRRAADAHDPDSSRAGGGAYSCNRITL